jgi:hypothetical protein
MRLYVMTKVQTLDLFAQLPVDRVDFLALHARLGVEDEVLKPAGHADRLELAAAFIAGDGKMIMPELYPDTLPLRYIYSLPS